MSPGLYREGPRFAGTQMYGKRNVLVTHPLNRSTGCVLAKSVKIPEAKKTTLSLIVSHHPKGDWILLAKANGEELLNMLVGKETTNNGWMQVEVDLSEYTGEEVHLELINQPNDWEYEVAYWAQIKLISK